MAVLLVMVGHFTLHGGMGRSSTAWLDLQLLRIPSSGWIGVDLFFVLSGFLITGILWDTREQDGYFRNFYVRRFLRIFPLYYLFLAGRFFVAPMVEPSLAVDAGTQWLYWTYLSNFALLLAPISSLFGDGSAPVGVYHFWSLAVEEQFYFLWPVLVWRLRREHLIRLCIALVIGVPIFRMGLVAITEPEVGYVFTVSRLDALAVGAFLALQARSGGLEAVRRWTGPALLCAVAVLLAIFVVKGRLYSSEPIMQTFGYSAVAIGSGALLVRALYSPGWAGSSTLQFLGKYCYGLYVFNGPLARLLGFYMPVSSLPTLWGSQMPGQVVFWVVGLALNVCLALLSWNAVERHFLKLKDRFNYSSTTAAPTIPSAVAHAGG